MRVDRVRFTVPIIAVCTLIGAASATTVYDNGAPPAFPASGIPTFPMTESVQAEDFVLTRPEVITGIWFYGLERGVTGYAGSIYWSIRADVNAQHATAVPAAAMSLLAIARRNRRRLVAMSLSQARC